MDEEDSDPQCPSCDSFGYNGTSCAQCGYNPDPQPPLTCEWCGGAYHGQAGDYACEIAAESSYRSGPIPFTEHNPDGRI